MVELELQLQVIELLSKVIDVELVIVLAGVLDIRT